MIINFIAGEVSTFVGKKKDGPFHYPAGIGFWKTGQCFFVCSQNHTVNKITMAGISLFLVLSPMLHPLSPIALFSPPTSPFCKPNKVDRELRRGAF